MPVELHNLESPIFRGGKNPAHAETDGPSLVGSPEFGYAPPPGSPSTPPMPHGSPGLWSPTKTNSAPDESGAYTRTVGYEAPSGVGYDVGSFGMKNNPGGEMAFASSADRESAMRTGFQNPPPVNTNEYVKENMLGLRGEEFKEQTKATRLK